MLIDTREIFKSCDCTFIYKITDQPNTVRNSESLSFINIENSIFSNNLVLIDSSLCSILAQLIKLKYLNLGSKVSKLLELRISINPLNINAQMVSLIYERRIKDFLSAVALGMTQDKVWTGEQNSDEHKWMFKDGDFILPHHILQKNTFENYLLNNTKLETPSSTRHGFGVVYEENGAQFIKLNLQIRFIR